MHAKLPFYACYHACTNELDNVTINERTKVNDLSRPAPTIRKKLHISPSPSLFPSSLDLSLSRLSLRSVNKYMMGTTGY